MTPSIPKKEHSAARRISCRAILRSGLHRSGLFAVLVLWVASASVAGAQEFPSYRGFVNDYADVIPPPAEQRLENLLRQVDRRYKVQMAIVTMAHLDGEDPTDYANRLYEHWGIGGKESNRGLLLLDARKERFVRIEVGYGLEGVLPDGRVGGVRDEYIVPLLADGRPDEAYASGTLALLTYVLEDEGRDPTELHALMQSSGYRIEQPGRRRTPVTVLIPLIIFFLLASRRRRGMAPLILGGMMMGRSRGGFGGGFGSFGGGGGGGGGFGGFGGGLSGGGGAGGSY